MASSPQCARSITGDLHVWSPPESTVRIEYAPSLLRDAVSSGPSGMLYGIASNGTIRVLAAYAIEDLDCVGMFSVHQRGEIFLTDQDLHRFEQSNLDIALVIAGSSAGFFVREPDGSIRSIKSHQEIPFLPLPAVRRSPWRFVAPAVLAAALAAGWSLSPKNLQVSILERPDQILITWTQTTGSLEILDGGAQIVVPVTPPLSSLTYVPRTHDVNVRLKANGRVIESHKTKMKRAD